MKVKYLIMIAAFVMVTTSLESQIAGSFEDQRDSKSYKTIKIGEQTWMAENLKFWVDKDSPHYKGISTYYGLEPENNRRYGRLYPWEVAQKVCPDGWHLPNSEEWNQLINSFGKLYDSTGNIPKLKSLTKEEAKEINQLYKEIFQMLQEGGSSGFDVLYGGYYDSSAPMGVSLFNGLDDTAIFWTSNGYVENSKSNNAKSMAFEFNQKRKSFNLFPRKKSLRCSVRCVKNEGKSTD